MDINKEQEILQQAEALRLKLQNLERFADLMHNPKKHERGGLVISLQLIDTKDLYDHPVEYLDEHNGFTDNELRAALLDTINAMLLKKRQGLIETYNLTLGRNV